MCFERFFLIIKFFLKNQAVLTHCSKNKEEKLVFVLPHCFCSLWFCFIDGKNEAFCDYYFIDDAILHASFSNCEVCLPIKTSFS